MNTLIPSKLSLLRKPLFLITVLIPTLCSIIYFGFMASDMYISESKFMVRSPQRTQSSNLLGSILSGSGFSRSQDDSLSVQDYVLSRDALEQLDSKLKMRQSYTDANIDIFSRFPNIFDDASFESFFKYYGKQVSISHDSASSISTLRVRAFDAKQSQAINETLLNMSEALVNQMNERGRQDLIKFAQAEATEAERVAKAAALSLAAFRNQRAVFDPDRQSVIQFQLISKLQDELIATKMQLSQISALTPQNPQIPVLQKRSSALQKEVDSEMAKIAGGGGNSLTNKATEFERLSLDRAFAERQLASAMASLENAKNEARRKVLYLERIVQPNSPDVAVEPKRLKNIITTLLMGLIAWGIISMLSAGIREHQD
ncbi:MAG: hypothetical protein HC765_14235 [Brachymonas sp.]|nr:hypothetical protein [Brachymonas sp.]